MARTDGAPPGLNILVPLATLILLVVALRYARDVLIPICLAILLTFILSPLVTWIEGAGLRRIPAIVVVSVLFVGATLGLGWLVGQQILVLGAELPNYRDNIEDKLESLRTIREGKLKDLSDLIERVQNEIKEYDGAPPPAASSGSGTSAGAPKRPRTTTIIETPSRSTPLITGVLGPVLQPAAEGVVVLVLVVFMLANKEGLRNRVFRLVGRGHLTTTTRALDEVAERVSRYLVLQSIVNTSFGFLVGLGLYLVGMPNPILWGVLSGLLRYLPYIGSFTAAGLPVIFAFSIFTGWHKALIVLGMYIVLEFTTANFVEPYLYGSRTRISALAILVAAIFWGVLWGPVGLLLSTPLTVCLVAFGKHIPSLEFLTILLGDEIQLSPEIRVYQRLLADDPDEAREIAKNYLEQSSMAELFDSLFVPVLVLAEQDIHRDALDRNRQTLVFQGLKEMIEDLSAEPQAQLSKEQGPGELQDCVAQPGEDSTRILAVPSRDEGDEIAAILLGHLLNRARYKVDAISPMPANDMLREIRDRRPDIVCVSMLPPLSLGHARNFYRKIKAVLPAGRIIFGMWRFDGAAQSVYERVELAGQDKIVTTLADCAYQIHVFCNRLP